MYLSSTGHCIRAILQRILNGFSLTISVWLGTNGHDESSGNGMAFSVIVADLYSDEGCGRKSTIDLHSQASHCSGRRTWMTLCQP